VVRPTAIAAKLAVPVVRAAVAPIGGQQRGRALLCRRGHCEQPMVSTPVHMWRFLRKGVEEAWPAAENRRGSHCGPAAAKAACSSLPCLVRAMGASPGRCQGSGSQFRAHRIMTGAAHRIRNRLRFRLCPGTHRRRGRPPPNYCAGGPARLRRAPRRRRRLGQRVPAGARGETGGWLRFGSTTARGEIWIGGVPPCGPWLLSIDHPGVAPSLPPCCPRPCPGPASSSSNSTP
jgi:hypothetical protein